MNDRGRGNPEEDTEATRRSDDPSRRWSEKMSDYGEWRIYEQCGGCRYYLRLRGEYASSWGVCTNSLSDWDGVAMFEHDGCEHFEHAADGWGGPHRSYDYKRDRQRRMPDAANRREALPHPEHEE